MAANQRSFDGWQKAQKDLSSVNDIYYEGWKSRSASEDVIRRKEIDGIWERETVSNPFYGEERQIESGYKYYYMNQFGEYFGTNDEFYDPARDPNRNNMEWRKVNNPNGY